MGKLQSVSLAIPRTAILVLGNPKFFEFQLPICWVYKGQDLCQKFNWCLVGSRHTLLLLGDLPGGSDRIFVSLALLCLTSWTPLWVISWVVVILCLASVLKVWILLRVFSQAVVVACLLVSSHSYPA